MKTLVVLVPITILALVHLNGIEASEIEQTSPICPTATEGFPIDIPIAGVKHEGAFDFIWLCIATPKKAEDIARIANWASNTDPSYRILPLGLGFGSKFSQTNPKHRRAIYVSTTEHLKSINLTDDPEPTVNVESGADLQSILDHLGTNNLTLYSVPNVGDVTIGGVLATTGGHGTGLPTASLSSATETDPGQNYGTLSGLVLTVTIVGWNPSAEKYDLVTLDKNSRDGRAILSHNLGRAFITSVKMRAGADQLLQTVRHSIPREELFGSSENSVSSLVDKYGRVTLVKDKDNGDTFTAICTRAIGQDPDPARSNQNEDPSFTGPARSHFFQVAHGSPSPSNPGRTEWAPRTRLNLHTFTVLTSRQNMQEVSKIINQNYQDLLQDKDICDFATRTRPEFTLRFTGVDDPSEIVPDPSVSLARGAKGHEEFDVVVWVDFVIAEVNNECEVKLLQKLQKEVKKDVEAGDKILGIVRLGDFVGSGDDRGLFRRAGETEQEYRLALQTYEKYDPHHLFN